MTASIPESGASPGSNRRSTKSDSAVAAVPDKVSEADATTSMCAMLLVLVNVLCLVWVVVMVWGFTQWGGCNVETREWEFGDKQKNWMMVVFFRG